MHHAEENLKILKLTERVGINSLNSEDDSLRMYELVQKFYDGPKSNILEIGAGNCALINHFIANEYDNCISIEKNGFEPYKCFLRYKIAKKDIEFLGTDISGKTTIILNDKENVTLNFTDSNINTELNPYYSIEYLEYCKKRRGYDLKEDFLKYKTEQKFNIILASNIFHLFPPEDDATILAKLKKLSKGGIIYIKVYNEDFIPPKNDNPKRYPFDNMRQDRYKSFFKLIDDFRDGNITELILSNKN